MSQEPVAEKVSSVPPSATVLEVSMLLISTFKSRVGNPKSLMQNKRGVQTRSRRRTGIPISYQ